MIANLLTVLGLALLASVKFLFAPAAIYLAGYNYFTAVAITTVGGFFGVWIFYRLGKSIIAWINKIYHPAKPRRKFTMLNRFMIKVRADYGLLGLSIITPCIISIPIGSVIAARFYGHKRWTLLFIYLSVLLWSLILNSITYYFGPIFT